MNDREILAEWCRLYGPLAAKMKRRFLARREVGMLQHYPDDTIRRALAHSQKLDRAVRFAREDFPLTMRRSPPARRRRRTHNDAALLKRIGPVQNYEEDTER